MTRREFFGMASVGAVAFAIVGSHPDQMRGSGRFHCEGIGDGNRPGLHADECERMLA